MRMSAWLSILFLWLAAIFPAARARSDDVDRDVEAGRILFLKRAAAQVQPDAAVILGDLIADDADEDLEQRLQELDRAQAERLRERQRLVFSRAVMTARSQLSSLLQKKITALVRSCALTDQQRRKLQLAGNGDLQRYLDRIERDAERLARHQNGNEIHLAPRAAPLTIFDAGSMFDKVLNQMLTPGQRGRVTVAAEIENLGGRLDVRHRDAEVLTDVFLTATAISNGRLPILQKLAPIRLLALDGTRVSDAGIRHLARLEGLEVLDLGCTEITGAGLEFLKDLDTIEVLGLRSTRLADKSLVHLAGRTRLKRLDLSTTPVSDAGVVYLKQLTSLEFLDLGHTRVTDEGLRAMDPRGLVNLIELSLVRTPVTDVGLAQLEGLPRLERLFLNGTSITDAGLSRLAALPHLEELFLRDTPVTDTGLAHLTGLPQLTRLDFVGTRVTDAGLTRLANIATLRTVDLRDTPVTDEGVAALEKARPELRVMR